MALTQKEYVDELKLEWKKLWRERIDDKVRAEGIAVNDYDSLFIDKGTVIHATRDFKVLNFKDILDQHQVTNAERYIPPDPKVGGWTKFVKDNITKQPTKKRATAYLEAKKEKPQAKKNTRGWLHI
ncbi:MAG: hypothetical protein M1540_08255 [Candidatus Bathyarchaeota archaeon]|nr:hypothetical protein [Candidatus Bathyarchaeota archaeon]